MTATATKTTTLKLTTNIPVDLDLKYIDVWPNDPSKNEGKGYGASISLKGTVDGEDVRIYPKGFVNKTIEKLVNYGVVEDGHYEHDPAEQYSIPFQQGNIRIVNAKPAGERYENFDILAVSGKATVATAKPAARTISLPIAPPKSPPSFANKPEAKLPEFLRDQEKQDAAELQKKIGFDVSTIQNQLALYQALTEFIVRDIAPIYEKGEVGMSPESAAASVQTLFINLTGGKK